MTPAPTSVPALGRARTAGSWLIDHGLTRLALRVGHRRSPSDPFLRLQLDPQVRADPYATYDQLREMGALVHASGMSAATTHAAATQVLRSPSFGTAQGRGGLPEPLVRLSLAVFDPAAPGPADPPALLALDPPRHTRFRRLITREFAARSVSRMEDRVREIVDEVLADVPDEPRFDLVEHFSSQVPLRVIADLLGVPPEMRPSLLEWGNQGAKLLDAGLPYRDYRDARGATRALRTWFDAHIARLRRTPGEDLLSRLATLTGEDALTDTEIAFTGLLVLGAGFETTVNLISNAVVQLSDHPDQRDVLRERPELWTNATEETLRYDSPVQLTFRRALEDVEIAGQPVSAGTGVLVMLAGANRDPDVFTDPHRYDVTRANASEHLALSSGVHYCVGAGLARLETAIALEMLYDRYPDLRVASPGVRRPTRVLRGYESLPVTTAAARQVVR
ncbi:cytochrome P450 [Luteipulveratus sp. YIM 133132]|uniref:cytochrome P450 n=1 Tax=Luteipulveratus flavus TaxID=3031728 RepID=UPI0023AE9AB6|nr:cytochrome P450 [Luteipulveratus sp. YIM 133132]MDE9366663.1 cytochrome P450 [Luteipulveratus sp. YIM 133132]